MRAATLVLASAFLSSSAVAQNSPRADLCAELSAYVTKEVGEKLPETAPTREQATAVQAPAKDDQRPQTGGKDAPQQTSGLSGPITHEGTGATGPQGVRQPTPPAVPATASAPQAPLPKPEDYEAAKKASEAKDLLACRAATQKMRRAGVALPAPLLALAAVDPKRLNPSQ